MIMATAANTKEGINDIDIDDMALFLLHPLLDSNLLFFDNAAPGMIIL